MPVADGQSPSRPVARLRIADRIGAGASLLCAIHCALLPIAVALLPTVGLGSTGQIGFEQGFALFATLLALATLVLGYRRHRTGAALLWLVPGLALVWFGAFGPLGHSGIGHAVVMSIGGTLVGAAHLINLRLARRHVHDGRCAHGPHARQH